MFFYIYYQGSFDSIAKVFFLYISFVRDPKIANLIGNFKCLKF